MKVIYYVTTETATFCLYEGEHSEEEIDILNHSISDFIEVITNAAKS